MPAFQHVLVASDFGPASGRALRAAADLASTFGARLSVVHVVPPAPYPYPIPPSDEARELAREQLEDSAAALSPAADVILLEGQPAPEIVRAAEDIGADLVVLGSRGRRGARRALLGSVAEKVVRLSRVPVLTLHPWRFDNRDEAGRELAAEAAHLRRIAPGIVAISRGAAVVAAHLGRSLDETPDLLLAAPVHRDDVAIGGICEDGTVRLDPDELARATVDPVRDRVLAHAKSVLADESTALRGSRWIGDVDGRAVVLVSDALDEPWSILAACDVLRSAGASRLIVAAPAATARACAVLEHQVDELIVIHETSGGELATTLYRDAKTVGVREASRALRPGHPAH